MKNNKTDTKKPTMRVDGSSNNVETESSINNPARITNELLIILVNLLLPTSKQGRRTVFYLGHNPDSKTGDVNRYAGVNISHVSRKCNKFLRPNGYEMRCRQPPKPILNRFGEASGQQLWGLYKIGGS